MKKSTKNILIAIGCLYLADIIICLSWEKSRKLTKQMIDNLKAVCTNYGLGNASSALITESVLVALESL